MTASPAEVAYKLSNRQPEGHRMPWHLYRMSLKGKVAVGNLTALGIFLLLFKATFPSGVVKIEFATTAERTIAYGAKYALEVLTFPVGWAPFHTALLASSGGESPLR